MIKYFNRLNDMERIKMEKSLPPSYIFINLKQIFLLKLKK